MKSVLVLCTGNSARSQIAEALLSSRGAGRIAVESAGSRPAPRANPLAIRVLAEHGVDWRGKEPRGLDAVADRRWDLVITVCDNARDACPVLPGQPAMAHWGMEDPAEATGSDDERMAAFRAAYDLISERVDALLALPLETLHGPALAAQAGAIAAERR
jgi:arsenate reductase